MDIVLLCLNFIIIKTETKGGVNPSRYVIVQIGERGSESLTKKWEIQCYQNQ
jgi:hypothetical protein